MSNSVIDYCMPLLQELDYSIDECDDRIKLVEKLFNIDNENVVDGLGGLDEFWLELFEQTSDGGVDTSFIKASLDQSDMLYSDTYIAKMLEIMGTYIIMSPDAREEEKKKKDKIRIYHSKELFNRALKERDKISEMAKLSDCDVLDVFVRDINYRKATDIKINNKAINENKCLNDYNRFLEMLQMKNRYLSDGRALNKNELKERGILRKQIASVKKDMDQVYKDYYKPIKFKQPLMGFSSPDWNALDMMQEDVVLELLKINKTDDINNDLNIILIDLDRLIDKISFTERQKEILSMYRLGIGLSDIGNKLGVTKQSVHNMMKGIVKKIVLCYMDEYSNWYYLNVSKGEYKTCNCCGETKLTSEFYKKGSGFKGVCKKCNKNS